MHRKTIEQLKERTVVLGAVESEVIDIKTVRTTLGRPFH